MISSNDGIPQLPEFRSLRVQTEAPVFPETFPDGRTVLVSGVPAAIAHLLAQEEDQGADQAYGALLGCAQIIRQFAPDFRTSDLVAYMQSLNPTQMVAGRYGLIAPDEIAQTLTDFDVPARVEQAQSSEDLAQHLESGSGVLVALNLGELWNRAEVFGNGDANAVAVAIAVARDPQTGDIAGWYLNDVVAKQIRVPVEAARMQRAWLDCGGWLIVTEIVRGGTA